MASITIADVLIDDDCEPQVIAEIGINHGGDLSIAKKMVLKAIESGARLIKHQTHIPDAEMSIEAKYAIPGNASKSIYEVISENSLTLEDEYELKKYTESLGAIWFSTPFSREAFYTLLEWDVPAFKIGSGECNNYPLVELIAKAGKPVIMSTGMNSIDSISRSVSILRENKTPFALMHTTNLYPTPSNLIRLNGIVELKENFPDAVVGLSDHSTSNGACIASISLGARILERHFTDSRERIGPDIPCSMDGSDLKRLIAESKDAFFAQGGGRYPAPEEQVTINFAFASVVAIKDIAKGETLTLDNIWVKRPSGGDFGPAKFKELLGRRAQNSILRNTQIKKTDLL